MAPTETAVVSPLAKAVALVLSRHRAMQGRRVACAGNPKRNSRYRRSTVPIPSSAGLCVIWLFGIQYLPKDVISTETNEHRSATSAVTTPPLVSPERQDTDLEWNARKATLVGELERLHWEKHRKSVTVRSELRRRSRNAKIGYALAVSALLLPNVFIRMCRPIITLQLVVGLPMLLAIGLTYLSRKKRLREKLKESLKEINAREQVLGSLLNEGQDEKDSDQPQRATA